MEQRIKINQTDKEIIWGKKPVIITKSINKTVLLALNAK
jgi:hypothetical protein